MAFDDLPELREELINIEVGTLNEGKHFTVLTVMDGMVPALVNLQSLEDEQPSIYQDKVDLGFWNRWRKMTSVDIKANPRGIPSKDDVVKRRDDQTLWRISDIGGPDDNDLTLTSLDDPDETTHVQYTPIMFWRRYELP